MAFPIQMLQMRNNAGPLITRVGGLTALATNTTLYDMDISTLGHQAGDVLLIAAVNGNLTSTQTFHATGNGSGPATGLANLYSNGTEDTIMYVGVLEVSSQVDTMVTVSFSSQNRYTIVVVAYRGVDGTTNLDVTTTSTTGINSGQPNPPSITPVTTGAKIVAFYGASHLNTTGTNWTAPSNLNNFLQLADTNRPHVGTGDADWTGGAFDPAVTTGGDTTASDSWGAATVALRPGSLNIGSGAVELVTNGTFDTNVSGWTGDGTANCSFSQVSGQMQLTRSVSTTVTYTVYQAITTVSGKTYRVWYDSSQGVGATAITVAVGTTTTGGVIASGTTLGTGQYFVFTATGTTTYVQCSASLTKNNTANFDNISVKLLY